MNFEEAKAEKDKLQKTVDIYSEILGSFPSLSNGLISDDIRNTKEYKDAKYNFDRCFKKLQDFNKWFVKEFNKEIKYERFAKYQKLL